MPGRRVPLIYSGKKQKEQTLTQYDPIGKRLVNVKCPCVTPSIAPSAPLNLLATLFQADQRLCIVTWDPPASPGSSAIHTYRIIVSPGNFSGVVGGSITRFDLFPLDYTTTYNISVTAINSTEESIPATTSITTPTPPSPPSILLSSDFDTDTLDFRISWTAPSSDGGSAITGYRITGSPGNLLAETNASTTTYVFADLLPTTTYTFNIIAINSIGVSSPDTITITTPTVAYPPINATLSTSVVEDVISSTIAWDVPTFNGGLPITGYSITGSPGNLLATTNASTRTCTFTGLTVNTAYTFNITATNIAGSSSPAVVSVSTNFLPISPPRNLSGAIAVTDVISSTITWDPPSSDGGAPIRNYLIYISPGNLSFARLPSERTFTYSDQSPNTTYTFNIIATNISGSADPAIITVITPTVPSSPRNASSTIAVTDVISSTITWDTPSSDGGTAITGYTITGSPGTLSGSTNASTRTFTFTGLTGTTTYTFNIIATNIIGNSDPLTLTVTTPVSPSSPRNISSTISVTDVITSTITWDTPSSNGGASITGYTLTGSPGNLSGSTNASTRTFAFTPLSPDTLYTFTVTAVNIIGNSDSATLTVTTPTVPSSPTSLLTTIVETPISAGTNIDCVVSWSVPSSDGRTAITGYTITGSPGALSGSTNASTRTFTFTGLLSATLYTFTVTATNIVGTSVAATVTVTTPVAYTVLQTFTASGTFTMPTGNPNLTASTPINLFIVAGGGGGGKLGSPLPGYANSAITYCSGGGAGGVVQQSTTLVPGNTYSVVVGNGGSVNTNGQSSSFEAYSALGGGNGTILGTNGGTGGSGGGGGGEQGNAGLGTPGQGNNGGRNGGGGGGAGGIGQDYNPGVGTGGIGINYRGTYYAGGGGANNGSTSGGPGGQGGGGHGDYPSGSPGTANTGGGGGAGSAGGSGIVIVSAVI